MPNLPDILSAIAALDRDQLPTLMLAIAARMAEAKSTPATVSAPAGLVNAAQAAAALDVPESWLRSQARTGKLPSVRCGKYVRFDIAEIKLHLANKSS